MAGAFLAVAHPAGAQGQPRAEPEPLEPPPQPARTTTLRDALSYAHAHEPSLRAALARVGQKAAEARIPSAQWLPVVGATAQGIGGTANNTTALYVTVPVLDIPRIGATPATTAGTWKPYVSTYAGAGLSQEVFDFGRIGAQRAAADALVEVEKHGAEVTRLDVDFGVEEAYFAVWAAKGVAVASEQAYARAVVHRDLARAGVAAGLRSPIEGTRAEAVLARYDIGRIRARGGVATAQSVLAAAIGAPDAAVDVAAEAPRSAEMPALTEALRRAAEHDPRVLQALAQLKAEEERTRAIGAELRPDLSATGTLSGRAGGAPTAAGRVTGDGLLPYVPNWDVGLILAWPVFDGTIRARRDASRAEEGVRVQEIAVVRSQEVARVEQTYVAFAVARSALAGLEQAVVSARANYEQADARFRANLGTAVELADAEDLRASAEIDLALGQFELARARAAFGRAVAETTWDPAPP